MTRKLSAYVWPATVLVLPLILLLSSMLTLRELTQMQAVYLRNRAATIAARLETLPPEYFAEGLEGMRDEEPDLVDIAVFDQDRPGADAAMLEPIWSGQELFRTQQVERDGEAVFRAYIPFHSGSRLHIARIDLAGSAADFLVSHARHNVLVASVSGLALVLLGLSAIWSGRRTARLERRQLELEHLAHLGMMSAVLAHEIRNPLATIKGFAQLAAEQSGQSAKTLLSPILDEVRRLERLVADLLLYGRPPEPVMTWTSWETIASDLEAHAREAIGGRAIRFEADRPSLRLRTDPDLLKAALLNLVRNAIEALADSSDGFVRLSVAAGRDGRLSISVQDNGPGLSEAARQKLFEPFFTTKAFGTGLGLAITRKLAAALGGELRIDSAEPHGLKAELVFTDVRTARDEPHDGSNSRS